MKKDYQDYEDQLAQQIEFSDDDEFDEKGNLTLKNAAQYLSYKPAGKKKDVDEMRYYESVARIAKPYMEYEVKGHKSYKDKQEIKSKVEKRKKENDNHLNS